MRAKIIFLLFISFSNFIFGQKIKIISQDSTAWDLLKKSAHQIGFCIFHSNEKVCHEHENELAKREKVNTEDLDVYYFEMKKEWAEKRLSEWANRQEQPIDNFLILFDISQKTSLSENQKEETINLFRGFILIDLTDSIDFVFQKKDDQKSIAQIKSDGKNALMENVLWREFMTGRLGRFSQKIKIKLVGKNAESNFEKFRDAFLFFQKEIK